MFWTLFLLPVSLGAAIQSSTAMKNAGISSNKFSLELLQRLYSPDHNVFFSPFSLSSAFAMTYLGANGSTAQQIAQVFHFDEIDPDNSGTVHAVYGDLVNMLNHPNANYSLNTANRLIADKQFKISTDYQNDARKFYHAPLEQLDFANEPEKARLAINKWVEDETHNKIKNLFPPGSIDSLTALILANAIYFKGNWQTEFDVSKTAKEPFHLSESKHIDVPMMSVKDFFRYTYDTELQAKMLEMPYNGDHLSMIILLPDSSDGLKDLISKLTVDKLSTILDRAFTQQVKVKLPRFQIESEFSLKEQLQSMGLVDLFSDKADLSRMVGGIPLTGVMHKAILEVDEKGTEAAAVTALIMEKDLSSRPRPVVQFYVDRPFWFGIFDLRVGLILFEGTVQRP